MAAQYISEFRPGQAIRLGAFSGLEPGLVQELAALRMLPGEALTVVAAIGRTGPVMVQGPGGTFALGRRLADVLVAEALT
jgi:Fe2+ transport system protein FeoA